MADRTLTHKKLVDFFRQIATANNVLKGFYRFNWNEINGLFRPGVEKPALLLESYSAEIEENINRTTHFNKKAVSFLIIDQAGAPDNYEKQEQVLDDLENTALDILAYLKHEHKNRDSFLFGLLEADSLRYEKVGPIFDNFYGWNILFTIKNHEPMRYDPLKWTWP